MSKLIQLSSELQLPIDIVTMRVAILGTSDAGKTTFGRLVAERVHEAGQRFCAIDLKNDWWGLKSSADGDSAGIPIVIFGGPKRDVQIFDDAGAAVADTVASIEQSCVIDLDDFDKKKQLVFLTAFLNRLYDKNRKPLFLMADEADRYAPQQPGSNEAYESLAASEDICRRGRKRGIGSMWISQRNAVMNKSITNMCDLTVVFRTPGSRDLKELKDSVGRIANEDQLGATMKAAPGLDNGQIIALSAHPKLRKLMPPGAQPVQMPMPSTFDSSATPRVGQRKREPKVLAHTDLAAIEQQMAQQVERAKANDPKALKAEVARLQRDNAALVRQAQELQLAGTVERGKTEIKRVEVPVLKNGQLTRIEKMIERFGGIRSREITHAQTFTGELSVLFGEVTNAIARIGNTTSPAPAVRPEHGSQLPRPPQPNRTHGPGPVTISRPQEVQRPAPRPATDLTARSAHPAGETDLPPRRQRILDALLFFESIGQLVAAREWVAFFCDTSPNSSTYERDCGGMRTAGLISYPSAGRLQLQEPGRQLARATEPLTLAEFHAKVERLLPPRRQKIARALIDVYPDELRRDQLAERVGTSVDSSTFERDLGGMRTAGLLIYPQPNYAKAADLLFPPLAA